MRQALYQRRWFLGPASTGLLFVGLVVALWGTGPTGGATAAPPTEASVPVFQQCANGKAPGTATDCPDGWINGILNSNNSHYSEDDSVPQRVVLDLPSGGSTTGRTVTIEYEARKGSIHAYDSLATWDFTQTTANACEGMGTGNCVTEFGTATTFTISSDPTVVNSAVCVADATSNHELPAADREMTIWGGTITSVSVPAHDNEASATQDDFASVTVTYSVSSLPTQVMLAFGGHTAASTSPSGWGTGCGSASISGGPYHIFITATDGASVGNRDNQIMSVVSATPTPTPTATATPTSTPAPTAPLSATLAATATPTPTSAVLGVIQGPVSLPRTGGAPEETTHSNVSLLLRLGGLLVLGGIGTVVAVTVRHRREA